jgi:selenocysteine lyase/cysteine desulfurase
MNATSAYIDENFKVIDARIQDFFKASKRDMAIVVVCSFLAAFALSRIIGISIERGSRQKILKRTTELEANLTRMEKEATDMAARVKKLKVLDEKYSQQIKQLTKKEPFITLKMVLFGIITLLVGVLLAVVTKVGLK